MTSEQRQRVYFFMRAKTMDVCRCKMREMDQLALEVQRALNEKKREITKKGKDMDISAVTEMIQKNLQDEILRMGQLREELEDVLKFKDDAADSEEVIAIDMTEVAGKYKNIR